MKIRSFAFLLSLVVVMTFLSPYNFIVHAEGIIAEETIDDTVMVQSDYADNRVLVVLDNETSLQFNEYDVFFFPGLDCKSITNLTPSFTTIAKAQIENKTMSNIQSNININNFEQILCIELNNTGKDNVARAIKLLESIDGVKSASPDYILSKFSTTPNDTYTEEWPLDNIQLTQAWDIATGSASIKVGVIDSGIDGTHPDLSANINYNLCRDFTSGSTLPMPSPTDTDGHGTAVAGIIGAKGNNGIGISGICWDVQLVALKITTDYTDSYTSHIVSAIDYAQSQNIPILNLSLGGYMPNTTEIPDPSMYSALSNYTGLAVCSAGNHGQNIDNQITVWPAGYDLPNIISVGCCDLNDTKLYNSNYGATNVDIFAPSHGILSCSPVQSCADCSPQIVNGHFQEGYHSFLHTSSAAPMVAGVAALLLSRYPNLTPIQIKQAIIENDDNCSSLAGLCVSGGRLNAYKVLTGHIHYYTYNYVSAGNRHRSYCSCGAYIVESHTFVQSGSIVTCTKCNHQVILQSIDPELETE